MAWIEVTEDEVRAARIEAMAARSAGLRPDPLVVAIAKAEPHTPAWIEEHGGPAAADSPDEISQVMDRGLRTVAIQERAAAKVERKVAAQRMPERLTFGRLLKYSVLEALRITGWRR